MSGPRRGWLRPSGNCSTRARTTSSSISTAWRRTRRRWRCWPATWSARCAASANERRRVSGRGGRAALAALVALLGALGAVAGTRTAAAQVGGQITLPPGFALSVFASDVQDPRFLSYSPQGDLYVGQLL